jgi:anti-sigma B factor antagonist
MKITVHSEENLAVIQLEGEIDLHGSPTLRESLMKNSNSGRLPVLLDFSAVEYIDSSGLATLIEFLRGGNGEMRRMALSGLQSQVKMVFELVRLNELFPIFPTVDEARAFLSKPQ